MFFKRRLNELRINNYNPAYLSVQRANMDIKIICARCVCMEIYIANYISKAQKGMSELLRQACVEARKANSTIK